MAVQQQTGHTKAGVSLLETRQVLLIAVDVVHDGRGCHLLGISHGLSRRCEEQTVGQLVSPVGAQAARPGLSPGSAEGVLRDFLL